VQTPDGRSGSPTSASIKAYPFASSEIKPGDDNAIESDHVPGTVRCPERLSVEQTAPLGDQTTAVSLLGWQGRDQHQPRHLSTTVFGDGVSLAMEHVSMAPTEVRRAILNSCVRGERPACPKSGRAWSARSRSAPRIHTRAM
jgi:hypothetical protein